MNQLELEAGQEKKKISMKLWISLPDKAVGPRNSHCFKTWFNHIMQGFINLRIAADRETSLCYRFLSCWHSSTAKSITIKKKKLHLYYIKPLHQNFFCLPAKNKKVLSTFDTSFVFQISFPPAPNPVRLSLECLSAFSFSAPRLAPLTGCSSKQAESNTCQLACQNSIPSSRGSNSSALPSG